MLLGDLERLRFFFAIFLLLHVFHHAANCLHSAILLLFFRVDAVNARCERVQQSFERLQACWVPQGLEPELLLGNCVLQLLVCNVLLLDHLLEVFDLFVGNLKLLLKRHLLSHILFDPFFYDLFDAMIELLLQLLILLLLLK